MLGAERIEITTNSFVGTIEHLADPRIVSVERSDEKDEEEGMLLRYTLMVQDEAVKLPMGVGYSPEKGFVAITLMLPHGFSPPISIDTEVEIDNWCRQEDPDFKFIAGLNPDFHFLYLLKKSVLDQSTYDLEGWISRVINFTPKLATKIAESI